MGLHDGIRTAHAAGSDLVCEVIIDEGGVEIGGRHIRGYEGRGRRGRIADGGAEENIVDEIGVSLEEVTLT
jgi:hypothetical protein